MTTPRKREPPPADAIQLGVDLNGQGARGIRYNFVLLVFMRVVACLWMLRGVNAWHAILSSDQEPFAIMPRLVAAATIFFAVADPIAAVGLWLATSWGGVLWLFAAAASLVETLIEPGAGVARHIVFAADLIMIVGYFVLSWYAARERDD